MINYFFVNFLPWSTTTLQCGGGTSAQCRLSLSVHLLLTEIIPFALRMSAIVGCARAANGGGVREVGVTSPRSLEGLSSTLGRDHRQKVASWSTALAKRSNLGENTRNAWQDVHVALQYAQLRGARVTVQDGCWHGQAAGGVLGLRGGRASTSGTAPWFGHALYGYIF